MENFIDFIAGNLTTEERIWAALAPGVVLLGYVLISLAAYTIRCVLYGQFSDAELENRDRTVITGLWTRLYFAWAMRPIWWLVLRSGIPASAITTLSFLLSVAAGVSLAMGRFSLGGWLFIFGGICDFLDGRVARTRKEASPSGSLLDSVLDRYSDAVIFMGLAWFYRDSWVLAAVLVALTGSQLVSYVRARGESLGIEIKIGLMQRAERILLLGIGVALSPIVEAVLAPNDPTPQHRMAIMSIVLLAVTTQMTAARRLLYGLRKLGTVPIKGWFSKSKGSLLRNIISAIVATAGDFVAYYCLVNYAGMTPGVSTAIGCGFGAVINFTMNRIWTFGSKSPPISQMARYAFVSFTSALLNAGGVTVLLLVPSAEYRVAWLLVRLAVFLAWNFPLQRDYVFKDEHE